MRELDELSEELYDAMERGVQITVFSLTDVPGHLGRCYNYGFNESDLELTEKRNLILIRDNREMLMGEANVEHPKKAAWTHNEAFIEISTNYIIQDIMLFGLRTGKDISAMFSDIKAVGLDSENIPVQSVNLSERKLRKLVTQIPFKSIEE